MTKVHPKQNKKSIAFIHGPLVYGGAEKALINLLRFFDYDRFDVTLWLKDGSGEMQSQVDPRVKIRYWEDCLSQSFSARLRSLLKSGRSLLAARSLCFRVLSRLCVNNWHRNFKYHIKSVAPIDDAEYDALISYHSLVRDDVMVMNYALRGKKRIGWIHGACRHDHSMEYFKPFLKEYPKLDRIFCVSKAVRELFLQKYPALEPKTEVMYNLQCFGDIRTLADEAPDVPFRGTTIVTVGRLAKEKGQTMIPAIADILHKAGLDFTWYLVGDGPTRDEIAADSRALGVEDHVILLGNKPNPYPYIKNCSLYVQTSFSEGFCLTVLEAAVLQKRIVTTDVPVLHESLSTDCAIVSEQTAESLAEGIQRALSQNDCQCSAVYFSDETNYAELKKLYRLIEE